MREGGSMREITWFEVIDAGVIDRLKKGTNEHGLDGKDSRGFAKLQLEHAVWWATTWGKRSSDELATWLQPEANRLHNPEPPTVSDIQPPKPAS